MERKRVDATGATASSGGTAGSASAAEQSAAEYLERHSVTLLMHDLLAVLLENRPAEPIDFISDYFDHVVQGDGGEPIERCCRYIRLSKPGAKPFMDNLAAAYATLDLHQGLTTTRLAELVRHLCRVFLALVKQTQALMDPAHSETCEQVLGKIPLASAAAGGTGGGGSGAASAAASQAGPVSFEEFLTALLRAAAAKTLPRPGADTTAL